MRYFNCKRREPDLTEQKMSGGLAFLIGGNMAVAASGQGEILVRVDPAQSETLVATTNARLMGQAGLGGRLGRPCGRDPLAGGAPFVQISSTTRVSPSQGESDAR
jgi:hypothetical protein